MDWRRISIHRFWLFSFGMSMRHSGGRCRARSRTGRVFGFSRCCAGWARLRGPRLQWAPLCAPVERLPPRGWRRTDTLDVASVLQPHCLLAGSPAISGCRRRRRLRPEAKDLPALSLAAESPWRRQQVVIQPIQRASRPVGSRATAPRITSARACAPAASSPPPARLACRCGQKRKCPAHRRMQRPVAPVACAATGALHQGVLASTRPTWRVCACVTTALTFWSLRSADWAKKWAFSCGLSL